MKQRRLTIAFFLFCMIFSLIQTEHVKADTKQKIKLNYETETKVKSVELYQYKGREKKNQISNYRFIGKMNDEDDRHWKMIIEKDTQNQYVLSIDHKEYLGYFSIKTQDIGDMKTNIPEVFLSSTKFISEDGKQKVKIDLRTISRTGDPVSSKFQVSALNDIKNDSGQIKYRAGSKILKIMGNTSTEKYLYPGRYQILQISCGDGYVKSQKTYNFEVKKQTDCQIQNVS